MNRAGLSLGTLLLLVPNFHTIRAAAQEGMSREGGAGRGVQGGGVQGRGVQGSGSLVPYCSGRRAELLSSALCRDAALSQYTCRTHSVRPHYLQYTCRTHSV